MQPKIHKKDNSGWPVVSSVYCHTSSISTNVDYHLQFVVKDIPSYARDTKDFLANLNQIRHIHKVYLWHLISNSYAPTLLTMKLLKLSEKGCEKHPSKKCQQN